MSNFLSHHHELRIPAMETLSDLTKLIFHGKENEHHSDSEQSEESALHHSTESDGHHHDHHDHHKKVPSKAKRHPHAGPRRSVIDAFGLNEEPQEQRQPGRIGIRVDRIRSIYIREFRNLEEKEHNAAQAHHIHQSEFPLEQTHVTGHAHSHQIHHSERPITDAIDEAYESLITSSISEQTERKESPISMDVKAQEALITSSISEQTERKESSISMDDIFVTPQEPPIQPVKKPRFSVSKLRTRYTEERSSESAPHPATPPENHPAGKIAPELPQEQAPIATDIRSKYVKEHAQESHHTVSHVPHRHHSAEIHTSHKKQSNFSGSNLRKHFLDNDK